jgi:hypothetical protein
MTFKITFRKEQIKVQKFYLPFGPEVLFSSSSLKIKLYIFVPPYVGVIPCLHTKDGKHIENVPEKSAQHIWI